MGWIARERGMWRVSCSFLLGRMIRVFKQCRVLERGGRLLSGKNERWFARGCS